MIVYANWSSGEFTLSHNANTDYVRVGLKSLSILSASAQTGYVTSTTSVGDISAYTGVSSGTPTKGTCGVWLYVTDSDDLSSILLRIGSGVSDYTEIAGVVNSSCDGDLSWGDETFTLLDGWNYVTFDMDGGSETGTPDWTAVDYIRFAITFTKAETCYFDYFTIGDSNFIGVNGLGDRSIAELVEDTIY